MMKLFVSLSYNVLFRYKWLFLITAIVSLSLSLIYVNSLDKRFVSFSKIGNIEFKFLFDNSDLNYFLEKNSFNYEEVIGIVKSRGFFSYLKSNPQFYSYLPNEMLYLNDKDAFELFEMLYFDFYWDESVNVFVLKSASFSVDSADSFNLFIYNEINKYIKSFFCMSYTVNNNRIIKFSQNKLLSSYVKPWFFYTAVCNLDSNLLKMEVAPTVNFDFIRPNKFRIVVFFLFLSLFVLYTIVITKEISRLE